MDPIRIDLKNSIAIGLVWAETWKPMAQDMYLFNVCKYSRSEYKYWAVKYEYKYKYIASKYKYKYLKFVLEYYSSTSTSTSTK